MTSDPGPAPISAAIAQGRFDHALSLIDAQLHSDPDDVELHWQRVLCLEKLERFDAVLPGLELVLLLDPDFVPAIVKRVQYVHVVGSDGGDARDGYTPDVDLGGAGPDGSDPARMQRDHERAARAAQASRQAELELRRALALAPGSVEALSALSETLRFREDAAPEVAEEADALLDRAIALAPTRVDLIETRAALRRSRAMRSDALPGDPDVITTWAGMTYSRRLLEAALADHERCHALLGGYRHALRMGTLLHELGRYDEALQRFDEALAAMQPDDPAREFILQTRARSEHDGAGEREEAALLIESQGFDEGRDRTLDEDIAAQALRGAAQAVRAGKRVDAALSARISEDPDTLLAANIAQQILNVAHEPEPRLVEVDAGDYPAYQRRFAVTVARAAGPLDLVPIADAEARGMFAMLGQQVMIRLYSDAAGQTGVAAFALRPKWPGWRGWLRLLLAGTWRAQRMIECVSQFEDGTLLSTQTDSPSPFEYGGLIQIERLPASASLAAVLGRHRERLADHVAADPDAVPLVALDLEGFERRWRAGQQVKSAYRVSVGYVTDAELRRLLGAHYDRLGARVRAELETMAADYL